MKIITIMYIHAMLVATTLLPLNDVWEVLEVNLLPFTTHTHTHTEERAQLEVHVTVY